MSKKTKQKPASLRIQKEPSIIEILQMLNTKVKVKVAKVAIKKQYLKAIPFGKLQSRAPVAIMLSFYGFNFQVQNLMQKLSHKTRAYFVNAGGLKGFLVVGTVFAILKNTKARGKLGEITQYHQIEIELVLQQLESMQTDGEQ